MRVEPLSKAFAELKNSLNQRIITAYDPSTFREDETEITRRDIGYMSYNDAYSMVTDPCYSGGDLAVDSLTRLAKVHPELLRWVISNQDNVKELYEYRAVRDGLRESRLNNTHLIVGKRQSGKTYHAIKVGLEYTKQRNEEFDKPKMLLHVSRNQALADQMREDYQHDLIRFLTLKEAAFLSYAEHKDYCAIILDDYDFIRNTKLPSRGNYHSIAFLRSVIHFSIITYNSEGSI